MIPNFALSLSFEGLKLLHRTARGWTPVDEVPLDSADLAGDLAGLRAQALALEPEGMRTRLLIPDEQIRYLDLDGDRDAETVMQALEGATPYAVADLVVDHTVRDGRTYVAAVARETLDEAEGFAREHALNPVDFAAMPAQDVFPGEALFGAVADAGEEAPAEPDTTPTAQTPSEAPLPEASETTPPQPLAPLLEGADDEPLAFEEEPIAETDETPGDSERHPEGEDETSPMEESAAAPAVMADDDDEALLSPAPGGRTPDVEDDLPQAGAPVMPDLPFPEGAAPRPAAPPAAPPLPPQGEAPAAPSPEPEAPAEAHRAMPPAMPRPGAPPAPMPAVPPSDADRGGEAGATDDAEAEALAAGAALAAPPAPLAPVPATKAPAPQARPISERERMTVFGARRAEPERRADKRMLIAVLGALALLALLIGWWMSGGDEAPQASLLREGVTAAVLSEEDETTADPSGDIAPEPTEAVEAPAETRLASAAPVPAPVPLPDYDDYPAPARSPGAAISPAEAERIYAATGVWLRAPRLPLLPRSEAFDGFPAVELRPAVAPAAVSPLGAVTPDGVVRAQADPPPPGSVFDRDARGFIAATPEGTVTPQGAVIYSGRPSLVPPTRPGTPAPDPSAEDPEAPGETVTILVPEARPVEETAAPPPMDPPNRPEGIAPEAEAEAGTGTDEDEDEATPGGVVLDALRPAPRPEDETQAPLAAYEGVRPPLRPDDLVPDAGSQVTEAAEAQAQALAEAVAATPEAPPARASVADALVSLMADAPDPLANATPQAVPTARRPDTRPRNFDRVVAQQNRNRAAPAASAPEQVAGASVAPDGPVPGSVARAATRDDAINLREINLIGVYGKPGARRALVRLDNGRYLRVGIGDTLDGGRVTAIGDDMLNYVRRGRTLVLQIPD